MYFVTRIPLSFVQVSHEIRDQTDQLYSWVQYNYPEHANSIWQTIESSTVRTRAFKPVQYFQNIVLGLESLGPIYLAQHLLKQVVQKETVLECQDDSPTKFSQKIYVWSSALLLSSRCKSVLIVPDFSEVWATQIIHTCSETQTLCRQTFKSLRQLHQILKPC